MKIKFAWVCLLFCLIGLLSGCQSPVSPQGQRVSVDWVVNGQVLELVRPIGSPSGVYRIRLEGVEAPDLRQTPWGKDAKQYLTTLITDHPVLIEIEHKRPDRYNRLWAYVWLDRELLNEKLVEAGHALVSNEQAAALKYGQRLIRAQERARLAGLGVWNPERPMRQTPKEFREYQKQLRNQIPPDL